MVTGRAIVVAVAVIVVPSIWLITVRPGLTFDAKHRWGIAKVNSVKSNMFLYFIYLGVVVSSKKVLSAFAGCLAVVDGVVWTVVVAR